jgi:ABC transporter with metal-binding/Fe-S-binding domain ATP-binding protein
MRLAGLLSGGKDSVYASRLAQQEGHELAYLVSLRSRNPDSYMFHTVNIDLTRLQAEAWGVEYIEAVTEGEKEKELLDLEAALAKLDIDGVITGAIASNYQRERIDAIAEKRGLEHISPIWGMERDTLLEEMLGSGMEIIFSAVSAHGLDKSWLGEKIDENRVSQLKALNDKYGVDMCGEGGEYESLVVDAPWFIKRIEIIDAEKMWDGVSGRYNIREAKLVGK